MHTSSPHIQRRHHGYNASCHKQRSLMATSLKAAVNFRRSDSQSLKRSIPGMLGRVARTKGAAI
eukprot:5643951-Pleurochrysis_carterae.AAC.2